MINGLHTHQFRVARLLFGLFLAVWINGVVFRHAHRLSDGRLVIHAHPCWPFGKEPVLPNNHTAQELRLLDLANHLPITLGTFTAFLFLLLSYRQRTVFGSGNRSFHFALRFHCFTHRGPPAVW